MRGVRKEINYSEPCTNAPDKAQLSFGCIHLSTPCARSCSNGYNPNSTVLYLRHLSTVWNNLFLNSKGLSEIPWDIRTSTYQICRTEEKLILLTIFNKYMCNGMLVLEIYWKYCGKEEKLLLRSNFSSFPQYFLHIVRFSCLGRDQIFTSR